MEGSRLLCKQKPAQNRCFVQVLILLPPTIAHILCFCAPRGRPQKCKTTLFCARMDENCSKLLSEKIKLSHRSSHSSCLLCASRIVGNNSPAHCREFSLSNSVGAKRRMRDEIGTGVPWELDKLYSLQFIMRPAERQAIHWAGHLHFLMNFFPSAITTPR